MAVVYLPPDPRTQAWGQALQSLGGDAAKVIQARQLQETARQIGEVEGDSTLSESQRWDAVSKMGPEAIQLYGMRLKVQNLQATMQKSQLDQKDIQSKIDSRTQANQIALLDEKRKVTKDPMELAELDARIKSLQADVPLKQADVALKQAEVPLLPVKAATAQAKLTTAQADADKAATQQAVRAAAEGVTALPPSLASGLRPDITEADRAGALDAYRQGMKDKGTEAGGVEAASAYIKAHQMLVADEKDMPKEYADVSNQGAVLTDTVKRFRDEMLDSPTMVGPIQGRLQSWMMKLGLTTGDPRFASLTETQAAAIKAASTTSSGWVGPENVKLAADISPNIDRLPLFNMKAMQMQIDGMLPKMQQTWESLKDSNIRGKELVKQRLDAMQAVSDDLHTLSSKVYATQPPGKGGRVNPEAVKSVVMYRGNMVDPVRMTPIIDATKQYGDKSHTMTGAMALAIANDPTQNKFNVAPDVLLRGWQERLSQQGVKVANPVGGPL